MPSLRLAHALDLPSTLLGGQAFCWSRREGGFFSGWIANQPVQLHVQQDHLYWDNPALAPQDIQRYFCLDVDLSGVLGTFTRDPWLSRALQAHPGLRPVREEPWECLVNFLCSSLKQIVQIQQINARLRAYFGGTEKAFPTAQIMAEAGEKPLRACALGYRARHVWKTSCRVAEAPGFLAMAPTLATPLAAQHLEQLPGVGPKISRCILLYAYSRWDAFPIDVWVDRLIRELYFPKRRRSFLPGELDQWSWQVFGPGRGLAQLKLFHWFRTRPEARRNKAKGK